MNFGVHCAGVHKKCIATDSQIFTEDTQEICGDTIIAIIIATHLVFFISLHK